MVKELFFLVEESLDGGYEAKALDHPIFTEGDNLEELKTNIKDAVDCHFGPDEKPNLIRLHITREEIFAL
jgi:hypothetical protein